MKNITIENASIKTSVKGYSKNNAYNKIVFRHGKIGYIISKLNNMLQFEKFNYQMATHENISYNEIQKFLV